MKPEWRTTTVAALCRRMLDARQFDALPILADALQDAGCDDDRLLAQCQGGSLNGVEAERLVNVVFSEQTAAAVQWLEWFIEEIWYTYDREDPPQEPYGRAIAIGRMGIDEGHMQFWTDEGADFFREGEQRMQDFYRNWSLATGITIPEEQQRKITFSCAC